MIVSTTGNLLEADVDALVNTVNTVGVMGKGLALQFRQKYPDNYRAYAQACKAGRVVVGKMFVFERPLRPRYLINFPTKEHFRNPSKIEWIKDGLDDLVQHVTQNGVESIAIPPLGCGLGGLDWHVVKPMIVKAFSSVPQVRVLLFEPT